jgi:hypothetical protein
MSLTKDQKGMALLILPDVSAGYPSIFLPVSEAQQPQNIEAGQQIIWMIVSSRVPKNVLERENILREV